MQACTFVLCQTQFNNCFCFKDLGLSQSPVFHQYCHDVGCGQLFRPFFGFLLARTAETA
jgi:hypothetical protein